MVGLVPKARPGSQEGAAAEGGRAVLTGGVTPVCFVFSSRMRTPRGGGGVLGKRISGILFGNPSFFGEGQQAGCTPTLAVEVPEIGQQRLEPQALISGLESNSGKGGCVKSPALHLTFLVTLNQSRPLTVSLPTTAPTLLLGWGGSLGQGCRDSLWVGGRGGKVLGGEGVVLSLPPGTWEMKKWSLPGAQHTYQKAAEHLKGAVDHCPSPNPAGLSS